MAISVSTRKGRGVNRGEVVVEFAFSDGTGGLISLAEFNDGSRCVEVYRCDDGLRVRCQSVDYTTRGDGGKL